MINQLTSYKHLLLWLVLLSGCSQRVLDKEAYMKWCITGEQFIKAHVNDSSMMSPAVYVKLQTPACQVLKDSFGKPDEGLKVELQQNKQYLQLEIKQKKHQVKEWMLTGVSLQINDSIAGERSYMFQEKSILMDTTFTYILEFKIPPVPFSGIKHMKGTITTAKGNYYFLFDQNYFLQLPTLKI